MQFLVEFFGHEPEKETSSYALFVFDKPQLENLIFKWEGSTRWQLAKITPDKVTTSGYHSTAMARTTAPAPMREYLEGKGERALDKILYFGCGRDEVGLEALKESVSCPYQGDKEDIVIAYDPHHPKEKTRKIPNNHFSEIHCHYVLNVISKPAAKKVLTQIYGRLQWSGKVIISVRRSLS